MAFSPLLTDSIWMIPWNKLCIYWHNRDQCVLGFTQIHLVVLTIMFSVGWIKTYMLKIRPDKNSTRKFVRKLQFELSIFKIMDRLTDGNYHESCWHTKSQRIARVLAKAFCILPQNGSESSANQASSIDAVKENLLMTQFGGLFLTKFKKSKAESQP